MDELIKSIRNTHQALMVLCTLLLVVAVSALEGTQYHTAINEITSGQKILDATNWWEVSATAIDEAAKNYNIEVRKVWKILGFEPVPSDLRPAVSLRQSDVFISNVETVDDLLIAYDNLAVRYFYPDFSSLEQVLSKESLELNSGNFVEINEFFDIFLVDIEDKHIVSYEKALPSIDGKVTAWANIRIWNPETGVDTVVEIGPIKGELKTATISNEAIRELQRLFDLTGPINDEGDIFVATKSVWQQIRGLSLDEARATLIVQNEVDIYPEPISIFGINIPGEQIAVAAPVATIIILLYMLSHFVQLNQSKGNITNGGYDTLWVGFFQSKFSLSLVFVTIVILPIISNYLIALSILGRLMAVIVAITIAILSIIVWIQLQNFRKIVANESSSGKN